MAEPHCEEQRAAGDSDDVVAAGEGMQACTMRLTVPTTFPMHTHRDAQLALVYEGEWIDRTPTERRRLGPGDVLFHPAFIEHETHSVGRETRLVIVSIAPAILARFCSLYGNRPRSILLSFDDLDRIPDRIDQELARADEATGLVVRSLVLHLLAIGSRAAVDGSKRVPDWVARVVAYVNANLTERLTARRIAAVACLSESYLSHSFSTYFQCSLGEYVRNCRIRAGARALRHSSQSVKQIASDTGFSDQAHFCRAFKAVHRMTPTEYRKSRTRRDDAS